MELQNANRKEQPLKYGIPMTRTIAQKEREDQNKKEKERDQATQKFRKYINSNAFQKLGDDQNQRWQKKHYFCENSLVVLEDNKVVTVYMPAYIRCHFRNMTEMDIQNLSCRFVATMNLSFLLGTYQAKNKQEKQTTQDFAKVMASHLKQKLKVTFQNDFVMNIEDELSTNVSDSDRTIRSNMSEYQCNGIHRIYQNFIVTREFKFGLRSDILFFPLEQNDLDLVTTLNSIKVALDKKKQLIIRFNCMNIELPQQTPKKPHQQLHQQSKPHLALAKVGNAHLKDTLKDLYMHENDGKQLTSSIMTDLFQKNKNNPYFRNVKISFPLRSNSTEFGYYNLVEKQIEIHYTRQKQLKLQNTAYEQLKNCLFCRKRIFNYQEHPEVLKDLGKGYQKVSSEDRSLEDSYCNVIMRIPMLKASLGTIIQLCIPIFFLAFLGLVEFLYSQSTSGDQVRGQKIGSSTLIVATYISFIYSMRTVIPPTPSWSIFEVAVCILAASSLLPIIESIYTGNYQSTENPFTNQNGLFIAAFLINASLCFLIVIMLVLIKLYMLKVTQRMNLQNVSMNDLIENLTKRYFFVWRNAHCKNFMITQMDIWLKSKNKQQRSVKFERWRERVEIPEEEQQGNKQRREEKM